VDLVAHRTSNPGCSVFGTVHWLVAVADHHEWTQLPAQLLQLLGMLDVVDGSVGADQSYIQDATRVPVEDFFTSLELPVRSLPFWLDSAESPARCRRLARSRLASHDFMHLSASHPAVSPAQQRYPLADLHHGVTAHSSDF
jgi:hypothetical protein